MRITPKILLYQKGPFHLLEGFLRSRNLRIVAADEASIKDAIAQERYDMAILEEPSDGPAFRYVELLRSFYPDMPVIFLSSQSDMRIVLEGFAAGIDDYVIKPCNYEELACRIKAQLKHVKLKASKTIYKIGEYCLDLGKFTLTFRNRFLPIKPTEAKVLAYLLSQEGELCERKAILEAIWGSNNYFNSRSLDVIMVYLRKYLKFDSRIEIVNHRGVGYKLVFDPSAEPDIVEIK